MEKPRSQHPGKPCWPREGKPPPGPPEWPVTHDRMVSRWNPDPRRDFGYGTGFFIELIDHQRPLKAGLDACVAGNQSHRFEPENRPLRRNTRWPRATPSNGGPGPNDSLKVRRDHFSTVVALRRHPKSNRKVLGNCALVSIEKNWGHLRVFFKLGRCYPLCRPTAYTIGDSAVSLRTWFFFFLSQPALSIRGSRRRRAKSLTKTCRARFAGGTAGAERHGGFLVSSACLRSGKKTRLGFWPVAKQGVPDRVRARPEGVSIPGCRSGESPWHQSPSSVFRQRASGSASVRLRLARELLFRRRDHRRAGQSIGAGVPRPVSALGGGVRDCGPSTPPGTGGTGTCRRPPIGPLG